MERAIVVHPLDNYEPFDVEVTMPGIVRRIMTVLKAPSSIIAASHGKPPEAEAKPIPALLFEVDPSKPMATRSFVWLPGGTKLTYPGALKFVDSYIDENSGTPLLLYEVIKS